MPSALRLLVAVSLSCAFLACPPAATPPDGGTGGGAGGPTVVSVSPTSGPVTGGTLVSVVGTGFLTGAVVKFGDVLGTQAVVESSTRIAARSPAVTLAGDVDITVTLTDGRFGTLPAAFRFDALPARTIAEALLDNPATAMDQSGAATVPVPVIAQVEVAGVTAGAGQGAGVRAQVGVATVLSTPPALSDFTWSDATYLGDADGSTSGDLARDRFQGTLSVPGATGTEVKTYYLAARFSVDDSATWTVADRDGSSNGLQAAQLAVLTVSRASVDWCKLGGEAVDPPPNEMPRGAGPGPTIYGQVFKTGVTDSAGAGANVTGQLGYGPSGTDPATWTWANATFNRDTGAGANDEFQAVLPNPGPGAYLFAFRFTHDGGPWSYCDADGTDTNGFTEGQAGRLTVTALGVDSCTLQFPATLTTLEGQPSALVYGRVFGVGVTDGSPPSTGLTAEVGYGPSTAAPSAGSWQWSAATYNVKVTGGGEEYQGTFNGPAAGGFVYGYRVRYQGGPWTYCDQDGSENGFTSAQAGALTALAYDVDECVLVSSTSTFTTRPSTVTSPVHVQVRVPLMTPASGAAAGITAELGTGAVGTAPSTWTSWTAATYDSDDGDFDRYAASLTSPGTVGTYELAYRVRLGTGAYHYCDTDGLANGYQSAQGGRMTVAPYLIDDCTLSTVSQFALASGSQMSATARVKVAGLTEAAGAASGLTVQIGVGPQGDDASNSGAWGWKTAPFDSDITSTGEDLNSLAFNPAYNGTRAVSARASLDGVTWTYCDLDGSLNGYQLAQQYNVNVSDHDSIEFCNTQFPSTISLAVDGGVHTVYGQVYKPGFTPNAAAAITTQLGVGLKSEDPGLAWTWTTAVFNTIVNANNEYRGQLNAPDAGLSYAFRYTITGADWCYGDLNGNGFNGAGQTWGGFSGDAPGPVPNLGQVLP